MTGQWIRKYGSPLLIWLLCIAAVGLAMLCSARAEESAWMDHSQDFFAYAEKVAQLNASSRVQTADDSGTASGLYAVLCRARGELPSLEDAPAYAVAGPGGRYTLFYAEQDRARAAAEALSGMDGILYAECDAEVAACDSMEESYLAAEAEYSFHSWGADSMRFGAYLAYENLWGSGSAAVAVVDSGVCYHALLDSRILESGYDYVDADDDPRNDLFGHGTHVAGIVADCTSGAPVYIYPIRVLDASGSGKMSNVVNAVLEAVEQGVDVINLSFESYSMSAALDDAVRSALDAGITVVIAAGNSGCDTSVVCPAHLTDSGAIVVGSAELSDGTVSRASYSNYGESVDVYAYGSEISSCSRTGSYVLDTGTSMAAPHVSAAGALLNLIHPGISPEQVESRLKTASGDGAVNVPNLFEMIPLERGFSLRAVSLDIGDELNLPLAAMPATARETISYASSDDSVAEVLSGKLTARAAGTAVITAECTGLESVQFEITVSEAHAGALLTLPGGLLQIEAEAFSGDASIRHAVLPDGLEAIGEEAFAQCTSLSTLRIPDSVKEIGADALSNAVLLCGAESEALACAVERGLQYIIQE